MTAKAKFNTAVLTVTPAMAQEWLGHNRLNRNLRPAQVNLLAKDMAEGNWHLTGEAIKFAEDGELLDGQHRLHAVVQSGASVDMLVATGVEEAARYVMDTGLKRLASDALKMRGSTATGQYALLASSARWAFLFDEGMLYDHAHRQVSNSDVMAYVELYEDALGEAISMARPATTKVDIIPTVAVVAALLTSRLDAQGAQDFFTGLATGAGLTPGSPILALRSRLYEIKRKRVRIEIADQLSLVIRAWNAWRAGKSLNSIALYYNGTVIRCPEPK